MKPCSFYVAIGVMFGLTLQVFSAETLSTAATLMRQARLAYQKGQIQDAIQFASKAIEADSKNPQTYYTRGQLYEAAQQPEKAIADYTRVLEQDPKAFEFYQLRGTAHFKAGQIAESIADFDKYIAANPRQEPHHWQRGISYYYAKRHAEGQRQFELHQTVNDSDVENAVWHFLCVAQQQGVEKARALLIPVKSDPRIPMTEVFELFAGKGTPEAVLKAAEAGQPSPGDLKQRFFYAHLYLGLYYEAAGDTAKAKEHILKASGPYLVPHYMGDVAKVHARLRGWP